MAKRIISNERSSSVEPSTEITTGCPVSGSKTVAKLPPARGVKPVLETKVCGKKSTLSLVLLTSNSEPPMVLNLALF